MDRLKIKFMRRTAIISVMMIVALATSASGCVAGWGSQQAALCRHPGVRHACARVKPGVAATADPACGHALKSPTGTCGMRSFAQSLYVAFHAFEISSPLLRTAGNALAPSDGVIVVSSIGAPETDRGPPGS
jgi:hypothetical protein